MRWRDGGYRGGTSRTYRRGGDHGGYSGYTRYRPGGGSGWRGSHWGNRYGGGYRIRYQPTYYYTGYFHRPHFITRSGFSLGLVIGAVPTYGYRYYDPYCDVEFGCLDDYYDHCLELGHPGAILVIDIESGAPIATCVYDGGGWVVDDCAYGDTYGYGY